MVVTRYLAAGARLRWGFPSKGGQMTLAGGGVKFRTCADPPPSSSDQLLGGSAPPPGNCHERPGGADPPPAPSPKQLGGAQRRAQVGWSGAGGDDQRKVGKS